MGLKTLSYKRKRGYIIMYENMYKSKCNHCGVELKKLYYHKGEGDGIFLNLTNDVFIDGDRRMNLMYCPKCGNVQIMDERRDVNRYVSVEVI
jgi:hypothetical protein